LFKVGLILLTSWKWQEIIGVSVHGSVYHLDGPHRNHQQSKHECWKEQFKSVLNASPYLALPCVSLECNFTVIAAGMSTADGKALEISFLNLKSKYNIICGKF